MKQFDPKKYLDLPKQKTTMEVVKSSSKSTKNYRSDTVEAINDVIEKLEVSGIDIRLLLVSQSHH